MVPMGKLADIYGRKKIFIYGLAIFVTISLLSAFAPSGEILIALRFVHGFSGAMIFGTSAAILTAVFGPGERGRVLGINSAAVYIGLSVGPFLGGMLTHYFGWRSIFIVIAPIGFAILLLTLFKLKGEWAEAKGETFDVVGSALYAAMIIGVIYGLSLLPSLTGGALILVGSVFLFAFIRWETRVPNPVLNMALFRKNPAFTFSNFAALINYSATFAVAVILSLYLQYIKGFSPQDAGLILIAQPIVMATLSPLTGRLSDKIEPRFLASAGMALTTVSLILFFLVNETTGVLYIVVALFILGAGIALFSSPNTNAVMSSVTKHYYGVASATLGAMRLTGQMLSMAIVTSIMAVYVGNELVTPEIYSEFLAGIHVAFIIFAVLCFAGIFASLARGRMHQLN
jgi:MFS family permease